MPGSIPGIPGAIAFVGLKFAGYTAAGAVLKKLHPDIKRKAWQIAAMRTALGVVAAPAIGVALGIIHLPFIPITRSGFYPSYWMMYGSLVAARFLIWLFVIWWAGRDAPISFGRQFAYAFVGVLWSCVLDIPGIALAWATPGRIPIC